VASVLFGCSTALVDEESKTVILKIANAVLHVMFKFVKCVLFNFIFSMP
jgi:Na+/H+-dicarboxylate symporter